MLKNYRAFQATLVAAIVVLLAGCAASSFLPAGTTLRINQEIEIPSNKARAYVQNGEITSRRNVDPFSTYCSISMSNRHVRGEPMLVVLPGQFEIVDTRRSSERMFFPGTLVASVDNMYYPPTFVYKVEMILKAAEQPNVRALICERRVEKFAGYYATSADYPTLAEIGSTLGSVIDIETQ